MAAHARLRPPLEWILAVGVLATAAAAHHSNRALEVLSSEATESAQVGPLPDGKLLRVASLGFERLVADLYWIRAIFYVGGEPAREANYPAAEALAELITDVDPKFASAYVLMGSVLSGLRYDVDAGIRLLEKGARNTDYWRVRFMLGFLYFMEKGDYRRGAQNLQVAYERGGPTYLPLLISRLYAHGGDVETAILFLRERLRHETHPRIRAPLERRLRDALIQRDLGIVQTAIERYAAERGSLPADVAALVASGHLKRPLADPTGRAYRIENGRAVSETEHEVLQLKE